ncbi:MAG: hypothetical protein JEZ04_02395 [Spirochaetales bacterium]|nr:hypothetical protein [Spirochaetales bacterium]
MNELLRTYDSLSSRQGFNDSLLHFQSVMDVISDFEDGFNVADILNSLIANNDINRNQVPSIISALLNDKYNYFCKSGNLATTTTDFSYISSELSKLKTFDVVICYYHPELGYLVINPKNPAGWNVTNDIRKNEFITVFVGTFSDSGKDTFSREKTASKIIELLNGVKTKLPDPLKKGKYKFLAYEEELVAETEEYEEEQEEQEDDEVEEKQEAVVNGGAQRMTPLYSVPVTNELFHNGNVEAWKRIIQSYKAKNPELEVHIFYDGERILNIASLFKWGKVKHGSAILFAVAGDDIKDVAKLQKYLKQGASHQFEAFLKFPVNTVLNLF